MSVTKDEILYMTTNFENFLNKYSEHDWFAAIEKLLPTIHEVDRNAVQIWFRFYPLELLRYLQAAEDKAKRAEIRFAGRLRINNQIDSSHRFLYGHRFWTETKAEIERRAVSFNDKNDDLIGVIEEIAQAVAEKSKVDKSLTTGIAAIGLMTLVQVGLEAFKTQRRAEKPKG
jgi:hypothetical protein